MSDRARGPEVPSINATRRELDELAERLARSEADVGAALAMVDQVEAPVEDKVRILMEMALGLQMRPPRSLRALHDAAALYRRAIVLCEQAPPEADLDLWRSRLEVRLATALQSIPEQSAHDHLAQARDLLEKALPKMRERGLPAEVAAAEMNLGLVLQGLAGFQLARTSDAIDAYQRALTTFTRADFPTEFAMIHSNLASAFLSLPLSDERGKVREALAVESFEQALRVVTLEAHPNEYALLQNNLGNALQMVSEGHKTANYARAIQAYDEALKVRTRGDSPLAWANTISNRANALRNLPDEVPLAAPESGGNGEPKEVDVEPAPNPRNLAAALAHLRDAHEVFVAHHEAERAAVVAESIASIEEELLAIGATPEPHDPVSA